MRIVIEWQICSKRVASLSILPALFVTIQKQFHSRYGAMSEEYKSCAYIWRMMPKYNEKRWIYLKMYICFCVFSWSGTTAMWYLILRSWLTIRWMLRSHINTHLVEMVMSRNVARYSVFVGVTELSAAGISLILGIVSKNVESSPWLLVLPFVVSS